MRIAMGPRDLENGSIEVARRDTKEKQGIPLEGAADFVADLLNKIQENLFLRSAAFRTEHTTEVQDYAEFKEVLETKGGFVSAHWDGTVETEEKIKQETKATIRCIPLDAKEEEGKCIYTGAPSSKRVLFAKAY